MKRKRGKGFLLGLFVGLCTIFCTCMAIHGKDVWIVEASGKKSSSELQKDMEKAAKEKKALEAEKSSLEKEIAGIEQEKDDVVTYIQRLDAKQDELSERVRKNRANIRTMKNAIKKLRKEKKEAIALKKKQYDIMGRRIKYVYENQESGFLEILLGADTLADFFNRIEYVNKVGNYDKKLLNDYEKVCIQIDETQKSVEKKLERLTVFRQSLQYEEKTLKLLSEKKKTQLDKYQSLLKGKNTTLQNKKSAIAAQEEEMERLMAEKRKQVEAEEAARKKEEERKRQQASKKKVVPTPSPSKKPVNETATGYVWPLAAAGRITSYFGYREAPTKGASTYHQGIDISVPVGTAVLATGAGEVVTAAYSPSGGNYITIYHGNGVYSYYMHCSSLSASVGTQVSAGQQIALSGSTGISTGPHLHFAIYANGSYVNPLSYVSQ